LYICYLNSSNVKHADVSLSTSYTVFNLKQRIGTLVYSLVFGLLNTTRIKPCICRKLSHVHFYFLSFNFRVINLQNLSLLRTQLRSFIVLPIHPLRKSTILYKSKIFVIVRTKKIGAQLENWSNQPTSKHKFIYGTFISHYTQAYYSLFKNSST